jgi:hypothetical protein
LCNNLRGFGWLDPARQRTTLHFYDDTLATRSLLDVTLKVRRRERLFQRQLKATFRLHRPLNTPAEELYGRHLKRLQLERRYGEFAGEMVSRVVDELAAWPRVPSKAAARNHLRRLAKNRRKTEGHLSWEGALLDAAASSPEVVRWFLKAATERRQ